MDIYIFNYTNSINNDDIDNSNILDISTELINGTNSGVSNNVTC